MALAVTVNSPVAWASAYALEDIVGSHVVAGSRWAAVAAVVEAAAHTGYTGRSDSLAAASCTGGPLEDCSEKGSRLFNAKALHGGRKRG